MGCYCTKSGLKNCGCISKCIFWCMFLLRIARYKIGFLFKCSRNDKLFICLSTSTGLQAKLQYCMIHEVPRIARVPRCPQLFLSAP